MTDKDRLRRADLITSVLLFLLGLWISIEALNMPMKDSFGGVQNVWYVSPALFPLFIGLALMLMSIVLSLNAIRYFGNLRKASKVAGKMAVQAKKKGLSLSDSSVRFVAIVALLVIFVYMNIPRVDFFLSILLFLIAFMSMFYYDDDALLKKQFIFYLGGSALFFLYFVLGLDKILNGMFRYSTDVLILLFIIIYSIFTGRIAGKTPELKRKYKQILLISVVVPFILVPVFKYFLLVPLPTEGGIIQLMNLIWYSF